MKLSDTQFFILTAASQNSTGLALPLPKSLKGGAAQKVVAALIKNGLLDEVERRNGDPVWRTTGDGHGVTLVITDAGLAAIGVGPAKAKAHQEPAEKKHRDGTKQAALIDMLRRKTGATIEEISAATGWQKHTVRGAMAGALKKKLGLQIASAKEDGRGRVYRISA